MQGKVYTGTVGGGGGGGGGLSLCGQKCVGAMRCTPMQYSQNPILSLLPACCMVVFMFIYRRAQDLPSNQWSL